MQGDGRSSQGTERGESGPRCGPVLHPGGAPSARRRDPTGTKTRGPRTGRGAPAPVPPPAGRPAPPRAARPGGCDGDPARHPGGVGRPAPRPRPAAGRRGSPGAGGLGLGRPVTFRTARPPREPLSAGLRSPAGPPRVPSASPRRAPRAPRSGAAPPSAVVVPAGKAGAAGPPFSRGLGLPAPGRGRGRACALLAWVGRCARSRAREEVEL